MVDEKKLIEQILRNDLFAFNTLINEYQNLVFTIVNRVLKNREDTEDVCQEVFIKVYKNVSSFNFQSKLSTWIARIAYTTALNHLKQNKNKIHYDFPKNIDNFYFTYDDAEKVLIKKDVNDYVNFLINELPVQYKTVITLFHLKEFTSLEIVEITGMPEGTVKAYLFRARKLLKEKLQLYLKNEI